MSSYEKRMPSGILGTISRRQDSLIEPCILAEDIAIGALVCASNGKIRAFKVGDDAQNVYGVLIRAYPTQTEKNKVLSGTVADVLVRGYVNLICQSGTPKLNSAVYVRLTAQGNKVVGGIEQADNYNPDTSTDITPLPQSRFMGEADENGLTEIYFNK